MDLAQFLAVCRGRDEPFDRAAVAQAAQMSQIKVASRGEQLDSPGRTEFDAYRAQAAQLPFIYLGYWIRASRKMSYKTKFKPLELLEFGKWRPLTPAEMGEEDAAE